MANQGQELISSWVDERYKEIGGPVNISWAIERTRKEIRDLRVLAYVRAVARQSREENMTVLDELIVELKKLEEARHWLGMERAAAIRELGRLERARRAA